MKFTIDVRQREHRGQNNEEKNKNSCATKKNITGFYTEDDPTIGSLHTLDGNLQDLATLFSFCGENSAISTDSVILFVSVKAFCAEISRRKRT